jgi:hypothetical protein
LATRRVTMREAADILGVSKEAVRKRVIRGTLPSDTGEDGRRHVYLDVGREEAPTHERDALISQLRDEVAYLRDENRRKDEIIMQQAMTMRQITAASQEPPESPESPAPIGVGAPDRDDHTLGYYPLPRRGAFAILGVQ